MIVESKHAFLGLALLLLISLAVMGFSTTLHAQFESDIFGGGGGPEAPVVDATSAFSVSSAAPGGTYDAAAILDIGPEWHVNSPYVTQDYYIPAQIIFDTVPGLTPMHIKYPPGSNITLIDEVISVYSGHTVIPFQLAIGSDAADGDYTLPIKLVFQPCNNKACLPPDTADISLDIAVGAEGIPINSEIFASIEKQDQGSSAPIESAEQKSEIQQLIDEHGFWGYFIALGLAFVTGVLLSFSPCTYPMIPITVSIFAGRERSVGRGFILSLFYVGSMAVVYGIMGLIVSLVGGVFGAWLASTPVVIGIAVVFVIFSLSMFGLYELQVPLWLRTKLGGQRSGGGVVSSIILGVVAALVVSPCVGPFVAGILLYIATTGSPFLGFIVLFVFALGLGTLFMIIGTFSSAMGALPGAGSWMESVKKFFGFVLILMALYFLRTVVPTGVTALLTGLLLISFAVFGGGFDRLSPESGFFDRLKKFLGVLAFLLGAYLLLGTIISEGFILPPASISVEGSVGTSSHHAELVDWETDLETGLARASAENKPVLIDTWATWCANCRVLDKKTFGDPGVAQELKRFVPIKVQLENSKSEISKAFLTRFSIKQFSLPTTLLLNSKGEVLHIMQGVVKPDEMIAQLRKLE